MSDADDDVDIKELAERLRSAKGPPGYKAFVEDVVARMERTTAYYEALGEFVTAFARVETTLQQTLWMCAGVPAKVARAVFSGLKVEGCLQFTKRVADAKKWKPAQKKRLEEITERLGPLNKLRNDILHHGVSIDHNAPDSWFFTNRDFAHIPEKIREFSITPKLLDDASADLRKIFYQAMLLGLYELSPKMGSSFEKKMADHLTRAWLYKSPPPAKTAGKSRTGRRKQPPGHPSSHGKS